MMFCLLQRRLPAPLPHSLSFIEGCDLIGEAHIGLMLKRLDTFTILSACMDDLAVSVNGNLHGDHDFALTSKAHICCCTFAMSTSTSTSLLFLFVSYILSQLQNVTAAKHLPSRVHVATTHLCDRNKPVDLGDNEVVKQLGLNFDLARLTLHPSLYAKGRKCLLAVDSMQHKKKKPQDCSESAECGS